MERKIEMGTRMPGNQVTLLLGGMRDSTVEKGIVDIDVRLVAHDGGRLASGEMTLFASDEDRRETRWATSRSLAGGILLVFGENARAAAEEMLQHAADLWHKSK